MCLLLLHDCFAVHHSTKFAHAQFHQLQNQDTATVSRFNFGVLQVVLSRFLKSGFKKNISHLVCCRFLSVLKHLSI